MTALTEPQATELAIRIVNTMRPTPPLQDWVEELTGLNYDRAWAVFRTLRHDSQTGLRIGTFVAAYRDDLDAERRSRPTDPPPKCEQCGGTGWIRSGDLIAHGHTYSQVKPCRCTAGDHARRVHAVIATANGWHQIPEPVNGELPAEPALPLEQF